MRDASNPLDHTGPPFSSSHLLIFTSAHLHICSSSHLHSHLLSLSLLFPLSFLSPFSLSRLLYLSLFRPRVVPAGSHETSTLSHEMRIDRQKLRKNCDFTYPFRTKWGSMRKNGGKIAILLVLEQPFHTKWGSLVKNWRKLRFYLSWSNPFARNEGRSSKTEVKLRFYLCWSNPFARNEGRSSKTEEKLRIYLCRTCPGATLSHEMRVDVQKLR